jgi:queuine/archaeosine tRNA-ribosyltransferase
MMKDVRQAIEAGDFAAFKKNFLEEYGAN